MRPDAKGRDDCARSIHERGAPTERQFFCAFNDRLTGYEWSVRPPSVLDVVGGKQLSARRPTKDYAANIDRDRDPHPVQERQYLMRCPTFEKRAQPSDRFRPSLLGDTPRADFQAIQDEVSYEAVETNPADGYRIWPGDMRFDPCLRVRALAEKTLNISVRRERC